MMTRHLKVFLKVIPVAMLFLVLFAPCSQAGDGEITVIARDDTSLAVRLVVPAPQMKKVTLPEGTYTRLAVPGWTTTRTPGSPELPQRGMVIQVPSSGEITLEATADTYSVLPGLLPSYAPALKVDDDGRVTEELRADPSVYGGEGFIPGKIAEVEHIGIIRGVPVARLMIRPFQWDPSTGELTHYTEVRVKVRFGQSLSAEPAAPASSESVFSGALAKSIVNYRGAVSLKGPAQSTKAKAAPVNAIKVSVKQDGIYRITGAKLQSKGVKVANVAPATFRLHNMGAEVAIRVSMKGKKFAAADYIEFYGKGVDNTFTDTNVYWLTWGGEAGKRVTVLDGTVTGQGVSQTSFMSTARFEENKVAWALTPGAPDNDFWFWEKIDAPSTSSYNFTLPSVSASSGNAIVKVFFRGRTTAPPNPDHHTAISVNGTSIGSVRWNGDVEYIQEAHAPASLLREGTNTLTVESPGDTGAEVDTIYLNWFEVTYPRTFQAVGNELKFPIEGNGRLAFTIGSLTQAAVHVYDITDPTQVGVFSNPTIRRVSRAYEASLEDDLAGQKTYLAVADKAVRSPASLEAWTSTGLGSAANGADYILITARDFLSSLTSLVTLRQKSGFRVKAVAVEDIYNEFSYGLVTPQAIKDFLLYAYENWTAPAPTYVLLVGDGSYDYRGYLGSTRKSVVPVHLSVTETLGITPDDNWYVALEGNDVLPEMIIGRMPASTRAAAAYMAAKTVAYEKASRYAPAEALFAADNNETTFETINEEMIALLPAGITPRRVYLSSYGSFATAKTDLLSGINKGLMVTTYTGHGDVTHWAGESLLVPDDITRMRNTNKLTFVVTLDCLNGWFAGPSTYSISESLVTARNKGAIAAFSPSGLAYTSDHRVLGRAVFASMFGSGNRVAGVIATGSKIDAYGQGASADMVRIFTLLGDPALQIKGAR